MKHFSFNERAWKSNSNFLYAPGSASTQRSVNTQIKERTENAKSVAQAIVVLIHPINKLWCKMVATSSQLGSVIYPACRR